MNLNLPPYIIDQSIKKLREQGYLQTSFSVKLYFDGQLMCRNCRWSGNTDECIPGKFTKTSISCPECGAFCGELCK